ncbi:MAG: hypothetical protein R6V23_16440 [Bacteroidales bacterium]
MSVKNQHNKLPESFRKYFWDCNFDDLTVKKYPKFILERVLNFGSWEDIQWIKSQVGNEYFRKIATQSRRLDKKTLNYWKTIYQDAN